MKKIVLIQIFILIGMMSFGQSKYDVNNDGKVSMADANVITNVFLGKLADEKTTYTKAEIDSFLTTIFTRLDSLEKKQGIVYPYRNQTDPTSDTYEDVFTYSYTGTQGNVPDHKYEAWKQDFERYAVSTNKITAKQARDLFNQTVLAINKDAGAMEDIQQFYDEGYEGFSITLWLKDSKGRVLCKNTWN